jgi:predicted PurR-regulated permease PerM
MKRLRSIEILLIEVILYLILWFVNDYIAAMISAIFASVILLILFTSLVVELIERSKVPRWYFTVMFLSVLAPVIAGAIYFAITGELSWIEQ